MRVRGVRRRCILRRSDSLFVCTQRWNGHSLIYTMAPRTPPWDWSLDRVKNDLSAARGFTVQKINGDVGFGLVATREIGKGRAFNDDSGEGECILLCYPYSCAPLYETGKSICSYCFQMGKMSSCSNCHVAKYCCRDCQFCDWCTSCFSVIRRKYHKLLCPQYKGMEAGSSSIPGLQNHQGEYTLLLKTFEVFINDRKGAYSTEYNSPSMKMDEDAVCDYSPAILYFMNEFTNRNTATSFQSLLSFYEAYKGVGANRVRDA